MQLLALRLCDGWRQRIKLLLDDLCNDFGSFIEF